MKKVLYGLLTAVLLGCEAESEYSTWPCRFDFDNSVLDANLSTAMNPDSRGVFCKIWESGAYYVFQNNQGMDPTSKVKPYEDRTRNYILGVNNGIIVGFQTFNTAPYGGFVAYDAQCPNCVRRDNNYLNPKFPLTMDPSGIASCGKCGKKYDMNNGGILQNGGQGDVGLEKYLATTTGPLGYLSVGTKR